MLVEEAVIFCITTHQIPKFFYTRSEACCIGGLCSESCTLCTRDILSLRANDCSFDMFTFISISETHSPSPFLSAVLSFLWCDKERVKGGVKGRMIGLGVR